MSSNKLCFIHSTMNAGKSAQLQMKAHNYDERHISYLVLKSSIDTRDEEGVVHSRPLGDMKCVIVKPTENVFNTISND